MQVDGFERRSNCPISCWLDLFGDKWTMLVMRDVLLFNKQNYKEFVQSEEGIASNILADRLAKLVAYGLLIRTNTPGSKLLISYTPTALGRSLEPVMMAMANWSIEKVKDTYDYDDFTERSRG